MLQQNVIRSSLLVALAETSEFAREYIRAVNSSEGTSGPVPERPTANDALIDNLCLVDIGINSVDYCEIIHTLAEQFDVNVDLTHFASRYRIGEVVMGFQSQNL
ncbi:hypothetical protein [Halioxenophilus aromaticivorans]|uniref:Carrier domain-containing protein n=1 Tax=Halioxenophilus aromaticivorans TaxID=1306992 RepID=A0AAV3U738_9ALTE